MPSTDTSAHGLPRKHRLVGLATPLASIFGSGFLVIVSVLASTVGPYALPAMLGICMLAYGVGAVIRFNIAHAEPLLERDAAPTFTRISEQIADIALVPAYVISVTLYLNILSSYALGFFNADSTFNESVLTSGIIILILFIALVRGLEVLEGMEAWALRTTLAIISVVIIAFATHDTFALFAGKLSFPKPPETSAWHVLTVLGGTLIVVQGFETTRYLGHHYDAATRIRACRNSQLISTAVYLVLIALATPLMPLLVDTVSENGLMVLTGAVAGWLVAPLVLAAIFSQFSAAAADTIGASGNLLEFTNNRIGEKTTYIVICGFALILTWTAETLQILTLASRAFALYYLMQTIVAFSLAKSAPQKAGFAALGAVLAFITVFAVPVG